MSQDQLRLLDHYTNFCLQVYQMYKSWGKEITDEFAYVTELLQDAEQVYGEFPEPEGVL